MSYATQADIDRIYPGALEQAGLRNADGDLDTGAIAAALTWADGVIDTYVGGRYGLPLLTPTPVWIVDAVVDLALYRLTPTVVIETFKDRYTRFEAAWSYLRDIRDGKIDPPSSPAAEPPSGSTPLAEVEFTSGRRDFFEDY